MLRLIVQTKRKYNKKTQKSKEGKESENDKQPKNEKGGGEAETGLNTAKRSTAEAEERMNAAKMPCWIETHRRMKWRLAMRITSLPKETWARKAAEWNPGHSTKIKTCRAVGRPTKRWEYEINDFLATKGSDIKNYDTSIRIAKQKDKWKEKEDEFAAASKKMKMESS